MPSESITFDDIIKLCESGRPVIPLIGAGISVESGIPITALIVDYLAKVLCYFKKPAFHACRGHAEKFYRELYGYPDPYQLNADLWQVTDVRSQVEQAAMASELGISPSTLPVRQWMDYLVKQQLFDHLRKTNSIAYAVLAGWRALVHQEKSKLAELQQVVKANLASVGINREEHESIVKSCFPAEAFEVGAEWGSILKSVTSSDFDQIDALFQVLVRGRSPGASHRNLAFLTRHFGWRLVLTTNFDDLIERALSSEGLEPTVYDVWRSAELPASELVRKGLSVLKLHGSAYGLRVGESLDVPLKDSDKGILCSYMGKEPVLLIAGLGGADRRIRDVIDAAMGKDEKHKGTIIWVQFGRKLPEQVEAWRSSGKPIEVKFTDDAGAFLGELYARATGTHPASRTGYSAHSQRPLGAAKSSSKGDRAKPVHLFTEKPGTSPAGCGPIRMSAFATALSRKHPTIWVDVGTFQSVQELVVDIIQQCRKFDSQLPSVIVAVQSKHTNTGGDDEDRGTDHWGLEQAVRRIHDALRRGCYVLALDEIGAFGRPPTAHHGIPRNRESDLGERVRELCQFIKLLVENAEDCRDSFICLSITLPLHRFAARFVNVQAPFTEEINELVEMLTSHALVDVHHPEDPKTGDPFDPHGLDFPRWDWQDLFPLLCTFRRPRSIVALRKLALEYLNEHNHAPWEELDILLNELHERGLLLRTEGGFYWMANSYRDPGYDEKSEDATSEALLRFVGATECAFQIFDHKRKSEDDAPWTEEQQRSSLWALARLIVQHREIATYYYSDLYLASKDLGSFFEFLYHQIATIRYATILEAFLLKLGPAASQSCQKALTDSRRAEHNPVRRHIKLCGDDGKLFVHRERLNCLIALKHALQREESSLLSNVPSDTLLRWVRWTREKDLLQFKLRLYGQQSDEELEVEALCNEFEQRLLREEAKILREKTDYPNCIRVRHSQIEALSRIAAGEADGQQVSVDPVIDIGNVVNAILEKRMSFIGTLSEWIDDPLQYSQGLGADRLKEVVNRAGLLKEVLKELLNAVLEIASSCVRLNREQDAKAILKRLEETCRGKDRLRCRRELRFALMRLHLIRAELSLFQHDGWNAKNDGFAAESIVKNDCETALRACEEGLRLVREATEDRESYFTHCCYFHTHRARAKALIGQFQDPKMMLTDASQEFDRAIAGLDLETSSGRGAQAICMLRLADALMLQSDRFVIEECFSAYRENDAEHLANLISPAGKLFLHFTDTAREKDVARRVVSPWVDDAGVINSAAVEKTLAFVTKLVRPERLLNPGAGQVPYDIIREAVVRAVQSDNRLEPTLRRSLAYWKAHELSELSSRIEVGKTLAQASQHLARAEVALDRADHLLDRGRRNFHSWYLLNRLRAQLQFENLLISLSENGGLAEADKNRKAFREARFLERTKIGLRAIRDSLDNVFAGSSVAQRFRIPLNILWSQLLIACCCNAAVQERDRPLFDSLWDRWIWLNRSAGLSFLLDQLEIDSEGRSSLEYLYFEEIYKAAAEMADARKLDDPLAMRGFVELQLKVFPNPFRTLGVFRAVE